MPVRTAYAPVAGEVASAANVSRIPGGWIGYEQRTTGQSSITTVVDLTGLSVSVTVGTARRIRISSYGLMYTTVAGDAIYISIQEGATVLNSAEAAVQVAGRSQTMTPSVILTPTAGAHTYKLTASRSGTGSGSVYADATTVAFILVEDIGPAT